MHALPDLLIRTLFTSPPRSPSPSVWTAAANGRARKSWPVCQFRQTEVSKRGPAIQASRLQTVKESIDGLPNRERTDSGQILGISAGQGPIGAPVPSVSVTY